jgi:DNA repair exonuclease SbcCD ATPase subunit
MRFVRLSLRNICQIETLDWEFGDGLIGVYGPNGSGKSNAMLVATHVALTGTYSRHPQGKAGVLMDGAQEGSIELVVRCNDTDVNIRLDLTRTLKDPKIKFLLRYHDGDTLQVVSDHGPVYACLSEKFGVDAAMLSDYVLVSQTSLCDMVSQLPSDRVKALGRLCGTDHSEAVWKALTNRATLLRSTLASVAVIQDDTAELLRQAGKRLREHKQQYVSLRDAVPRKQERTALRNVIANRAAWQEARKDKEELDAEQLRLTREANRFATEQTECKKQQRTVAKRHKQAKRQALQARQALQQYNAVAKARRTYVTLRRDIAAAEATSALPDVPVPKSRWADAGKRQTQLQRELYLREGERVGARHHEAVRAAAEGEQR